MLSVQPCSNVSFGYQKPKLRGLTAAEIEVFRKANGESPSAIESRLLSENGRLGTLPSTQGGSRILGIKKLSDFYEKIDNLFN